MTKHLFNFKISEPQDPQCKEDIRVARILWFALGFISALVVMFIAIINE
jgi:hypothetical protein